MASSHGHPGAALLAPRLAGVLFVAAALTLAPLGAPAASAALTDEVRPVAPEVGSVAETATGALPDLPAPVEIPDPPKAPSPPSSVPKPPPAATLPAPSGAEATAPRSSGGAGVVPEAEQPSALPAPAPDSSKPSRDGVGQGSGRASIGRAEAAPLYRLRAYVWPAIALRLRVALAPLGSLDDFADRAPVPDVLELLSPTTLSGVIGVNRSSGSPAQPNQGSRSPSEIGLPEEELGLLATLLIVLLGAVCLVALARLVVGEDLFEAQYWRGHRG